MPAWGTTVGSLSESDTPKYKRVESFFNFFNPQRFQICKDENFYDDGDDYETNEKTKRQMEEELDIGLTLRDVIIPHFASWFTGNATQGNNSEVKVEEDEESEVLDEDEEDDDECFEYIGANEDTEYEAGADKEDDDEEDDDDDDDGGDDDYYGDDDYL